MLTNPYNPLGIQWQDNHMVVGRVGQEDFFFLKRKFPYYPGLTDKLISNLYKAFIDELRRRDRETHIETALYIDDPSFRIIDDIVSKLSFVERSTVGEHSVGGDAAAQHDSGGTHGVHPEVQRAAQQRPDEKGSVKTGKRRSKNPKKKEE
jgi:hypothetical protein